MNKDYESAYHTSEENNWWFVARRDIIKRLLKKSTIGNNDSILDVGCAGGTLALELQKAGYKNVSVLDYSEDAIDLCKSRGLANAYKMDGHNPAFPDATFDVIIASDSLEHLEFDTKALKNWHRISKEGGTVIIFVPAFMFLWSKHDDINHHFRRYTLKELIKKVENAGFSISKKGYWNFSLFFPSGAVRLLSRLVPHKKQQAAGSSLTFFPHWLNQLLIVLLKVENRLCQTIGFPIGVSTFIVANKPVAVT